MIGTMEIIIIAVVLVLLFGASRIPALAKGIAEAVKNLKSIFKDDKADKKSDCRYEKYIRVRQSCIPPVREVWFAS